MPIRPRLEAERLRAIEEAMREHEQAERRTFWLTVLLLLVWPTLGALLLLFGFSTTHPVHGPAAVDAGALVATAGVFGTLLWRYQRRE